MAADRGRKVPPRARHLVPFLFAAVRECAPTGRGLAGRGDRLPVRVSSARAMIPLRFAWRELRSGTRGLRVVIACLALGVAAMAGVGGLRAAILQGLTDQGRVILGGDLAIEGAGAPYPPALLDLLRRRGARISQVVTMRSLLVNQAGKRMLVELKAVDTAYPLLGGVGLNPPVALPAALAPRGGLPGLVAERLVAGRLGLRVGDRVRLGEAAFVLRGLLTTEPDRASAPMLLAPRVMIASAALPATGLVQPGSLVDFGLRAVLPGKPGPERRAVADAIAAVRAGFIDQGWRIRDERQAATGATHFIDQVGFFMSLVALAALLVGGIGVSTGVRAWLDARAGTIATLRCLGADATTIFTTFLIQILTLAGLGVAIGLAAGALLPIAGCWALAGVLPVTPRPALHPGALGLAALYGMLTAIAFALWPLGRAVRIPAAALFRDALLPAYAAPTARVILANAAAAAALVALVVTTAPDRRFAAWFCIAAGGTLLLFRAGGVGLAAAARLLRRGGGGLAPVRLGLGNLQRPGAPTPLMMVSVGLGLATLAAVGQIEGNLRRQMLAALPARAPSFFFIDLQPDEIDRFNRILRAMPAVREIEEVPSLRARIVAVAGVPAEQVRATPDTSWALRGDRGLTYAATPPAGTAIVAGRWWPPDYTGPPLLSFDAGLARGWGVHLGDVIRVSVLGRDVDLRIANLRDIAWRSLGLNFAMIASPGLLSGAPHTDIATVRAAGDAAVQAAILDAVTDALPNVTGIRVADVLETIATLLGQMATALAATGGFALAAGALVLAGTVAAGQRRRMRDAVILKSLGATRGQIRTAWLVEFGSIGLVAGSVAAGVGSAAAWAVMRYVLHAPWTFLPGLLVGTICGSILLMLGVGYAGTAAALGAKPARFLRNE